MPVAALDVPDLNLWLALIDPDHAHHARARYYWETEAAPDIGFCRVTMLGLLRLLTNSRAMHNLNSIYEGGGYKHEGIKYYEGEYREKHLAEPGDMIVTNTEQGFDHLLIGHAAIVPRCFGPKGIFSHHIYRVRFQPSSPFNPHYLVELFNNRRWHYWISGFSNGTTINMLPSDALEMPLLTVPPKGLVKKFTAIAQAAHDQIEDNIQQSRTLATLRDTLLPKLLSGELSVHCISDNI